MNDTSSNKLNLREVINKVVHDPEYKSIAKVPLLSFHQIGLTLFALGLVTIGLFMAYNGLTLWLVYPIMIFGFHSSFTPLHDATHHAVSSNKLLNDVLGSISGSLLFPFVTTAMYRYFHLAHHRYVGDEDLDPDEAMVGIPAKYFPAGYLVFFVYEYFIFKWLFTAVWKRTPIKTKIIVLISLLANLSFQFIMFSSPFWQEYLLWFFIPNRLGAAYTTFTFAHLPHPDGVHGDEHPFESTYTLTGNKLAINTLWGQEDHSMHHFLPNVPWYKYKKVWNLANGILHKQNIPEKLVYSFPDQNFKEELKLKSNLQKDSNNEISVSVASVTDVAKDIKSFVFKANGGNALPAFSAGAHITINLPSGKRRQYSLVNSPSDSSFYQIAVKKDKHGKGGSVEMHDSLVQDDSITISPPKNHFLLYENVQKYILISGGIGITPLIAMAHRLIDLEKHFEFHICAKNIEDVPFQFELKNYSFAPHIDLHLDDNGKSTIELNKVFATPSHDTLIYVCGPSGFNKWVKKAALENGWDESKIMIEAFSMENQPSAHSKPFEVILNKTGKSIKVAKDATIIDSLLMNGIKPDYSCLRGTCGTCVVDVVNGKVDHRDSFLPSQDKINHSKICLCVSRAKEGKIEIDL